ncbi:uncharacterized protein [Porites lutea]|uniref:uncharacterized protein n=1 Tax=Porites lutea TaxID=51062 RepID=UPI003CC567F6
MFVLEGKKKGEEKNYIVDHFSNMAPWDCCRVWRGLVWSLFAFYATFLLITPAQLPRHFVLKPHKSIDVLQGQNGEVTCEAVGSSVSTLKWEKQQDDQSYAAVPNSQVNITKDSNYVRATLKIKNAQFADAGTYKCTVSVPPNKSDYRLATVRVKVSPAVRRK